MLLQKMAGIVAANLRDKRRRDLATANSLRIRVSNTREDDEDSISRRSAVESRRSSGEWEKYRDGLIKQQDQVSFL